MAEARKQLLAEGYALPPKPGNSPSGTDEDETVDEFTDVPTEKLQADLTVLKGLSGSVSSSLVTKLEAELAKRGTGADTEGITRLRREISQLQAMEVPEAAVLAAGKNAQLEALLQNRRESKPIDDRIKDLEACIGRREANVAKHRAAK